MRLTKAASLNRGHISTLFSMKFALSLLLAVNATPFSKHQLRAEGILDDARVYIATNTDEACEQPALNFFEAYVQSGVSELWTTLLGSDPTDDEVERSYESHREPNTPMEVFWHNHIRENMLSYNVIQTGPNTFSFFCKFKHWTLYLTNPFTLQEQLVRYRMRCPGHISRGEYFGRINFRGRGTCDLVYPLPQWRQEYLLALEEAENTGKTIAGRARYHQQMWIDSLRDDLATHAAISQGR